MIQKIIILFAFIGLVCLRAEKECQDFLSYGLSDREQIMELVKEASLLEGRIEVSHGYFENDTELTIINKMNTISKCFQLEEDSLNAYLSKSYIARLYYRMGDFNKAEKEIANINKWTWEVSGTEIAEEDKFESISQFVEGLNNKFNQEIEGSQSDFATMTIRIAPTAEGTRLVPEGRLVNDNGATVSMSILLPSDGDYIFDDDIKKRRFMYLKNEISSLNFDHNAGDGSHDMEINYLPLLPQGKKYIFLIKDISNGILQRYKAEFSQFKKDELEIAFSNKWMIKLSAPEGMIKLWLPESLQYELSIEDNAGNKEIATLEHIKDKETGGYYNIYRLESMQNKDTKYDYKLIYEDNDEKKPSFIKEWKWRFGLILLSGILILNQMDT